MSTQNFPKEQAAPFGVPEIPGIDTCGALCRMDGDKDLYLWVLQAFVDTHADSATAVAKALDNGERPLAERLVHTVKGNAGSVGAGDLQEAALLLESAIRCSATREELQDLLACFSNSLEQLLQDLARALRTTGKKKSD